jgi:hypothetical protein
MAFFQGIRRFAAICAHAPSNATLPSALSTSHSWATSAIGTAIRLFPSKAPHRGLAFPPALWKAYLQLGSAKHPGYRLGGGVSRNGGLSTFRHQFLRPRQARSSTCGYPPSWHSTQFVLSVPGDLGTLTGLHSAGHCFDSAGTMFTFEAGVLSGLAVLGRTKLGFGSSGAASLEGGLSSSTTQLGETHDHSAPHQSSNTTRKRHHSPPGWKSTLKGTLRITYH